MIFDCGSLSDRIRNLSSLLWSMDPIDCSTIASSHNNPHWLLCVSLPWSARLHICGSKDMPKYPCVVATDSTCLSLKVVWTKHFTISIIKQTKHEVMFAVSLSKYEYRDRVYLVICLIMLAHVTRAKNIPPRPLPFS